jgi:hypothetical protein
MKMRIKLLFVVFCSVSLFSKALPIDTVKSGVYLKSLYDFNSSAFSYDVDLWMWFKYTNDSLKPLNNIEIANAKQYFYSSQSTETRNGVIWASQNCKATINQNWDLQHYPFDRQKLEIIIEETDHDIRKVALINDVNNFQYNDQIDIKGWRMDSSSIKNGVSYYQSDFGDPTLKGQSEYSKIYYTIYLSRDSWSLFLKLFTGCYVAFLVSFLVFFIKPRYVDPRFGLSIGGLFAAVGNKYVVDSNMPESISFTLVDKIHDITFVYILAALILSILSLRMYDKGLVLRQIWFDKRAAILILLTYIIVNVVLIFSAISG